MATFELPEHVDPRNQLGLDARWGIRTDEVKPALEDKVVLITGAGSGMGKATAIGLPFAGAKVVVLDFDEPSAKETVRRVREFYPEDSAYLSVTDVTKPEVLEAAYRKIIDHYGRLDVLVNCAGTAAPGRIHQVDVGRMLFANRLNIDGYELNGHYASKAMVELGIQGVLINISSASARIDSSKGSSVYNTAKEAQCRMVRAWAQDLGEYGIRANALLPGDLFGQPELDIYSGVWNDTYYRSKTEKPDVPVSSDDPRLKQDPLPNEVKEEIQQPYIARVALGKRLTYGDVVNELIKVCLPGCVLTGESIPVTNGNPGATGR